MFITADQITASNKSNLDAALGLAAKTFGGFEKLVELNMAAAKALMTESISHLQAALAVKDVQQVIALQSGLLAPTAEKAVSYARHVYSIAVEMGAAFTKEFEGKTAEGQKALDQVVEKIAQNAPAGSESAIAILKNAMASSQSAIESAHSAAKQALSIAESNVAAATEQALSATVAVSKKA